MVLIMNACLIVNNMIFEKRSDDYDSKLWDLASSADRSNVIIDENGDKIPFHWYGLNTSELQNSSTIPASRSARDTRISDEGQHFSLKADLVEHISNHFTKE